MKFFYSKKKYQEVLEHLHFLQTFREVLHFCRCQIHGNIQEYWISIASFWSSKERIRVSLLKSSFRFEKFLCSLQNSNKKILVRPILVRFLGIFFKFLKNLWVPCFRDLLFSVKISDLNFFFFFSLP